MFQAPTPNKYKQNYIECIWVLSSEIFFFFNLVTSLLASD